MSTYNEELHKQLLKVGRTLEKRTTHQLEEEMIDAIVNTMDALNVKDEVISLAKRDLYLAKFKIWDWLGMEYTHDYDEHTHSVFEKFVKIYVTQKNVGGFTWYLLIHDLLVENEPKFDKLCNNDYEEWHNATPEDLAKKRKEMEDFYGGNVIEV